MEEISLKNTLKMSDSYLHFANRPAGKFLCSKLGLPIPPLLDRAQHGPLQIVTNLAVSCAPNAVFESAIENTLDSTVIADEDTRLNGLVFDASGITHSAQLETLYQVISPQLKRLNRNAKIVIVGLDSATLNDTAYRISQRALVGFVKSLAKELGRKGITVNLIAAANGCHDELAAPLAFLCSKRNVYVTGQVIKVSKTEGIIKRCDKPLQGKLALVTGATQGIGLAMAQALSNDGATVIGLDIPAMAASLSQAMDSINGESLALDISGENASQLIAAHLNERTLDIIVHNAGITRDKTLGRMQAQQWQQLLNINLVAIERVNHYLLKHDLIAQHGRIIGVSSINGIAGAAGQTNYATAKAGVIGMVDALSEPLQAKGITINAVAPGFIETRMTAAVPFMPRQIARRACSFSQGGLPIDVAQAVALFAAPQSQGLTGNVLRVCGQNIIGA